MKKFKAVQTGGPSGGCIPTSLDLPVDYERLTEAGSMMGSGGMIVMDKTLVWSILQNISGICPGRILWKMHTLSRRNKTYAKYSK